jgi:hypothetical protein
MEEVRQVLRPALRCGFEVLSFPVRLVAAGPASWRVHSRVSRRAFRSPGRCCRTSFRKCRCPRTLDELAEVIEVLPQAGQRGRGDAGGEGLLDGCGVIGSNMPCTARSPGNGVKFLEKGPELFDLRAQTRDRRCRHSRKQVRSVGRPTGLRLHRRLPFLGHQPRESGQRLATPGLAQQLPIPSVRSGSIANDRMGFQALRCSLRPHKGPSPADGLASHGRAPGARAGG